MKDSDIDCSDSPSWESGFWVTPEPPRPVKQAVSLRLDEDVIAWFKGVDGKGYTTRINQVLRAVVQAQKARTLAGAK